MQDQGERKLAINLVQLLPNASGGIETYARELLPRLLDELPGWDVTVFVNREGAQQYPAWDSRCHWITANLSWFDRLKRLHYESTVLPRMLRRGDFDLLHNMVNTACLRPGCPQVTTIFDATPQLYPEPGESIPSKVFRKLLARSARRSDAILTISKSAGRDLERAYNLPASRIEVIPLAAREPTELLDVATVLREFDLPGDCRFFVTPAARRPNKNIERLVRAFAGLDDKDVRLLLPGADAGKDAALATLLQELGVADRVKMLGWITDQQLDTLYSGAIGLVFPSLAEGFGLPILEAMQCGCPVATSNVSSMPEVAGDAALLFDPEAVESITALMRRLIDEPQLGRELAEKGRARAREFSWGRAAAQSAGSYRSLLMLGRDL
ncbi:MAG: glycosyltransferase family 4 protein [Solirubrobacterales bacterium]|nr:glycosyltransferase family 4 protein [Solirubrobacterales bacterium]